MSVPRWYLWEGGFLLTARAQGVVPSHAHHAIQIVIALEGCIAICGRDEGWRESRGIVVRPDAEHSFDCNGALGVMLFVDPESSEGAWLSASLHQEITIVPDTRVDALVGALRTVADNQMTRSTSPRWCGAACTACGLASCRRGGWTPV